MFSNNVCLPLICWRKQKGIVWILKKYKSRRIKWRNALKNELHFLSSSSTTVANSRNDAKNNKLNIQNYPKIFLYRVKWLNGGDFRNHVAVIWCKFRMWSYVQKSVFLQYPMGICCTGPQDTSLYFEIHPACNCSTTAGWSHRTYWTGDLQYQWGNFIIVANTSFP